MPRRYLVHYALYMLLWLMALPALLGFALFVRYLGTHAMWLGLALMLPEAILALTRTALDDQPVADRNPPLIHLPPMTHRHF